MAPWLTARSKISDSFDLEYCEGEYERNHVVYSEVRYQGPSHRGAMRGTQAHHNSPAFFQILQGISNAK